MAARKVVRADPSVAGTLSNQQTTTTYQIFPGLQIRGRAGGGGGGGRKESHVHRQSENIKLDLVAPLQHMQQEHMQLFSL